MDDLLVPVHHPTPSILGSVLYFSERLEQHCHRVRRSSQHAHTQRLLGWLLVRWCCCCCCCFRPLCACAWQHGCGPHLLAQRRHPAVPHSQAKGSASGLDCCGLGCCCQTPRSSSCSSGSSSSLTSSSSSSILRQGLCWCWMMVWRG